MATRTDHSASDHSDNEEHNQNIKKRDRKNRRRRSLYNPVPGTYLFDFPSDALKPGPPSAARVHIRRVLDILHISIGRRDTVRARRAWSILVRCEELRWRALWRTAVHLLDMEAEAEGCAFLYRMRWDEEAESILREFILRSAQAGQVKQAYEVLDIRLHDFPYRDNAVLHIYAAFMCIFLGQQPDEDEDNGGSTTKKTTYDPASLRRAKLYLERAIALDPENECARELMNKVNSLGLQDANDQLDEVDEDSPSAEHVSREEEGDSRRKKSRNE